MGRVTFCAPHVLSPRQLCRHSHLSCSTNFVWNALRSRSHVLKRPGLAVTVAHSQGDAEFSSSTPVGSSSANHDRTRGTETSKEGDSTESGVRYRVQILHSVTEVEASEWDTLAQGGCSSPFLRHDWLRCLEQSGSAEYEKGWSPSHIVMRNDETNEIVALAPAYVKGHSMGEFVFDQEWADAAYGAGIAYYPKLLLAVPFTPATGRRILTPRYASQTQRERILLLVGDVLIRVCKALRVSSVHVNFCREDEAAALAATGFLQRKGVQYHFTNYRKGQKAIDALEKRIGRDGENGVATLNETGEFTSDAYAADDDDVNTSGGSSSTPYRDFEDYLSEFKSKRRIKMRRERTIVRNESGLEIEIVRGDAINRELLEQMFYIYKSTIDKMLYGRQYLTKQFFQLLNECPDFKQYLCLVLARRKHDGVIIGGTFNVIGDDQIEGNTMSSRETAFYGRYWGCTEEYRYLHFEACYYAAIEYCIQKGLNRMEPGAGGGEFKYMRGFEPSVTLSMHYLVDERLSDAVARYLRVETLHIDGVVVQMKRQSAIRSKFSPIDNGLR